MGINYVEIDLEEAQANLDELCNAVVSNRDVVLIKQPTGFEVALVAADELSSLIDTCSRKGRAQATLAE